MRLPQSEGNGLIFGETDGAAVIGVDELGIFYLPEHPAGRASAAAVIMAPRLGHYSRNVEASTFVLTKSAVVGTPIDGDGSTLLWLGQPKPVTGNLGLWQPIFAVLPEPAREPLSIRLEIFSPRILSQAREVTLDPQPAGQAKIHQVLFGASVGGITIFASTDEIEDITAEMTRDELLSHPMVAEADRSFLDLCGQVGGAPTMRSLALAGIAEQGLTAALIPLRDWRWPAEVTIRAAARPAIGTGARPRGRSAGHYRMRIAPAGGLAVEIAGGPRGQGRALFRASRIRPPIAPPPPDIDHVVANTGLGGAATFSTLVEIAPPARKELADGVECCEFEFGEPSYLELLGVAAPPYVELRLAGRGEAVDGRPALPPTSLLLVSAARGEFTDLREASAGALGGSARTAKAKQDDERHARSGEALAALLTNAQAFEALVTPTLSKLTPRLHAMAAQQTAVFQPAIPARGAAAEARGDAGAWALVIAGRAEQIVSDGGGNRDHLPAGAMTSIKNLLSFLWTLASSRRTASTTVTEVSDGQPARQAIAWLFERDIALPEHLAATPDARLVPLAVILAMMRPDDDMAELAWLLERRRYRPMPADIGQVSIMDALAIPEDPPFADNPTIAPSRESAFRDIAAQAGGNEPECVGAVLSDYSNLSFGLGVLTQWRDTGLHPYKDAEAELLELARRMAAEPMLDGFALPEWEQEDVKLVKLPGEIREKLAGDGQPLISNVLLDAALDNGPPLGRIASIAMVALRRKLNAIFSQLVTYLTKVSTNDSGGASWTMAATIADHTMRTLLEGPRYPTQQLHDYLIYVQQRRGPEGFGVLFGITDDFVEEVKLRIELAIEGLDDLQVPQKRRVGALWAEADILILAQAVSVWFQLEDLRQRAGALGELNDATSEQVRIGIADRLNTLPRDIRFDLAELGRELSTLEQLHGRRLQAS